MLVRLIAASLILHVASSTARSYQECMENSTRIVTDYGCIILLSLDAVTVTEATERCEAVGATLPAPLTAADVTEIQTQLYTFLWIGLKHNITGNLVLPDPNLGWYWELKGGVQIPYDGSTFAVGEPDGDVFGNDNQDFAALGLLGVYDAPASFPGTATLCQFNHCSDFVLRESLQFQTGSQNVTIASIESVELCGRMCVCDRLCRVIEYNHSSQECKLGYTAFDPSGSVYTAGTDSSVTLYEKL